MLFASSCAASKEEIIKEYDEDSLVKFLEEELDIVEDLVVAFGYPYAD